MKKTFLPGLHRPLSAIGSTVLALAFSFSPPVMACEAGVAAFDSVDKLYQVSSVGRDALVLIRRLAQDWKNLLIRGTDPKDAAQMKDRMNKQSESYATTLQSLEKAMAAGGLSTETAKRLQEENRKIQAAYALALSSHGVATMESALAADKVAQGVDVPTFRQLEALIADIDTKMAEAKGRTREEIARCGAKKL